MYKYSSTEEIFCEKPGVWKINNASSETILPHCARFEIATKRTSIVIQFIPNKIVKLFLYLKLNVTTDCHWIYVCRMNNMTQKICKFNDNQPLHFGLIQGIMTELILLGIACTRIRSLKKLLNFPLVLFWQLAHPWLIKRVSLTNKKWQLNHHSSFWMKL